jgi:hypothetical protein
LCGGKGEELESMGIGGMQWNEYELEWSKGGIDYMQYHFYITSLFFLQMNLQGH